MQDTLYTALGDISFYDAHFVKVSQINKFCSTEQISQAWLETIWGLHVIKDNKQVNALTTARLSAVTSATIKHSLPSSRFLHSETR